MKAVPVRQCAGCRAHLPKNELARVVRSPLGEVTLDKTGKSPGRGVYICPKEECLRRAQKSRALERALKAGIEPLVYQSLAELIARDG